MSWMPQPEVVVSLNKTKRLCEYFRCEKLLLLMANHSTETWMMAREPKDLHNGEKKKKEEEKKSGNHGRRTHDHINTDRIMQLAK